MFVAFTLKPDTPETEGALLVLCGIPLFTVMSYYILVSQKVRRFGMRGSRTPLGVPFCGEHGKSTFFGVRDFVLKRLEGGGNREEGSPGVPA